MSRGAPAIAILIALIALAVPIAKADVPQDRMQRIYEATCRVSVPGGVGTGTVFKEDDSNYYILTNAHVVGANRSVGCEFVKEHWPSPRIAAQVVDRRLIANGSFDVAVVRVAKTSLNGVDLPVVPLADPDDEPAELRLITCGCQAGEMPSLQQTLVAKNNGQLVYYLPPAKPGRSGSALVDVNCEKIFGLVAWETVLNNNQRCGLAMTAARIRPWLVNRRAAVQVNALPPNTREIPLAPPSTLSRIRTVSQSQCDPNSPWCPLKPTPKQPTAPKSPGSPWSGKPPKDSKPSRPPKLDEDALKKVKSLLTEQAAETNDRFDKLDANTDELCERVAEVTNVGKAVECRLNEVSAEVGDRIEARAVAVANQIDSRAGEITLRLQEQRSDILGIRSGLKTITDKVVTFVSWIIVIIVADWLLTRIFGPQWMRKVFGPIVARLLTIKGESKAVLRERVAELEKQQRDS